LQELTERAVSILGRDFVGAGRRQHWAQHLEGSYPLASELRTLRGLGRTWLYIDHGWRDMSWSSHCNTEVVRWSLRECGVTLPGPDPRTLVDEVPAAVLRARMRDYAGEFLPELYRSPGWNPDEPPRAGLVQETMAFAEYARARAAGHPPQQ
jgi:hypothetical protein